MTLEGGWGRLAWVLSVPPSHLTPLLVTRETNLKFRQAPVVTHQALTNERKMASFQGERWRVHPPHLGLGLPLCTAGMEVPISLGFGDGDGVYLGCRGLK